MEERKTNFKEVKETDDKGSKAIRLLEKLICENLSPEERGPYFEALEHICCNEVEYKKPNILIVSIYDSAYEMSIWYDNKIYDEESDNELFNKIEKEYYNRAYDFKNEEFSFDKYLKSLDFEEIYVCEDGFIERIK